MRPDHNNTSVDTILVVDDIQDNLDLMEALLLGEGFEQVVLVNSGQQALNMLKQRTDIGVVLLDLMMPDMDGYEVCRRISTNPKTQLIPVIVVTGAGFRQNEVLLNSFAAGAMDFIHKPFNEVELCGRIRVALDLHRERRLRQDSVRQLIDNEARFRAIINQAPVGITQLGESGKVLMANRYLSILLGYDYEELLGKNFPELCLDPECHKAIQTLLAGKSSGFAIETRLRPQDDSPIWVHLSASPLRYADVLDDTYILILENITKRKRSTHKMIERMVYYDALTHLPNRTYFNGELKRAILQVENNEQIAILFLDLDNFKNINDGRGHVVGDRLLQNVAKRIQTCIRSNDLFSRFGGDEFTLLLPHTSTEAVCLVAQKILDQMDKPVQVDEHEFYIGISIGISFFPQDGEDVETLLKNADTAMYRAKALGGLNYQLFKPAMDIHVQQRLILEQDLRRSLEQGDFVLHYQPQVNLKTMQIVGLEALIRWRHPHRGLLPPDQFLPLAEESGLILILGQWVIREACRQTKHWHEQGHNKLIVYVNLSRRQFQQLDALHMIKTALQEANLPATMLGIEITESVNSLDQEAVISSLKGFQDLGIKTAIDDFGMGYSSLSNLKHLPLDTLKIDKSFVRNAPHDADDFAIIQTIIALGRSFGLQVVAEGVENENLLEFVKQQGCDIGQGYLFGKPQSAERLQTLLDSNIPR